MAVASKGRHSIWLPLVSFRGVVSPGIYFAVAILSLVFLIATWELVARCAWFPSQFFPSPLDVARESLKMLSSPQFLADIACSAARIGAAFCISALIAIPLGIVMSSFRVAEAIFEPAVDIIRYVPVPALVPIFIIWAGIGEGSKFLVLFFGTFFQLVLLVMDDSDNVPSAYFELARTLGARTPELFRDVLIPYLMPQIYDRLRITLGWCWTYLIIAELIAVDRGIGHAIKEAQRFGAAGQMFVCFVVLGAIGLLTDYLAKLAYRFLFPYAIRSLR
jgi:NitT/TauT family transport system permease protein